MEISHNEEAVKATASYPQAIVETKSAINPQSLLWALIAVVLFVIYNQQEDKDSTLGIIQISLVMVCAIVAIIKMFAGSKKLTYQPTGSIVDKQSYNYNVSLDSDIRQCLKEGNTAKLKALKTDSAGGLQVEFIESRDKVYTAARLLKYEPCGYEVKTDWMIMN